MGWLFDGSVVIGDAIRPVTWGGFFRINGHGSFSMRSSSCQVLTNAIKVKIVSLNLQINQKFDHREVKRKFVCILVHASVYLPEKRVWEGGLK